MTPRDLMMARQIGELCIAGDHACESGDLEGLRDIAMALAAYKPEPVHCELVAFADACRTDPDGAIDRWASLKACVRLPSAVDELASKPRRVFAARRRRRVTARTRL